MGKMKIEVTSMALQPTPPFVRELVVGLLVALLMTLSSVHAVQAAPGDLDPTYNRAFERARQAGVEALCYACNVSETGIEIAGSLPLQSWIDGIT